MTTQQDYDLALAAYEGAAAEYERLNLIAESSADATSAYTAAQDAYARLVAAHEALAADLATPTAYAASAEPTTADLAPIAAAPADPAPPAAAPEGLTISGFDGSPLAGDPGTALFSPAAAAEGAVLRRGTAVRMVHRHVTVEEQIPAILRRNLLHANAQGRKAEITRNRRIVGNLPEWSPLPPGEIVARATRRRPS